MIRLTKNTMNYRNWSIGLGSVNHFLDYYTTNYLSVIIDRNYDTFKNKTTEIFFNDLHTPSPNLVRIR